MIHQRSWESASHWSRRGCHASQERGEQKHSKGTMRFINKQELITPLIELSAQNSRSPLRLCRDLKQLKTILHSGTFKWGDLNGGYVFLCDKLILIQQTKWLEGRDLCHLCGARLRTLLPHKCRIPPVPFPPPVKKCPITLQPE